MRLTFEWMAPCRSMTRSTQHMTGTIEGTLGNLEKGIDVYCLVGELLKITDRTAQKQVGLTPPIVGFLATVPCTTKNIPSKANTELTTQ